MKGTRGRKGDGKAPKKMGRGGMRAVLEGGAVGGEKSRTPPLLTTTGARSICSTYPGSQLICLCSTHRRRSMTCENRSIDDLEAHLRTRGACDNRFPGARALRMLLEIIVSRGIIMAFTDYERAVLFAARRL